MRVWACVMALVCGVATLDSTRDGRWLFGGGPITKVAIESSTVTRLVASSCVVMAPSLPPCRQMRGLKVAPSPTTRISVTESPALIPGDDSRDGRYFFDWGLETSSLTPSHAQEDELGSGATPLPPPPHSAPKDPSGWTLNDLFKGMFSTVTQTVLHEETKWMQDKDHVVTFSIVGCLPTELPFNLSVCEDRAAVIPTTASVDPRASLDVR